MPLENQELNHCQEKHEFLKLNSIAWVSFEEKKQGGEEGGWAKCLKYVRQSYTGVKGKLHRKQSKAQNKKREWKTKNNKQESVTQLQGLWRILPQHCTFFFFRNILILCLDFNGIPIHYLFFKNRCFFCEEERYFQVIFTLFQLSLFIKYHFYRLSICRGERLHQLCHFKKN